ncbi:MULTISPECIES: AAA family ATPase [unclassified Micromonospora]|uniref:AAA family ATPase n=1 Tax=unclassified Micromonospora TaxID=2617518 RepID=UPI003639DA5A
MTLADRLRWARERAFVGRAKELATFRAALRGEPDAPVLIYVYGPGGVGKSTLLRRFADEGRDAGRPVTEINGRLIDPSPAGFTAEIRGPVGAGSVLVVDAFEHCQGLDEWLRETFLPSLPDDALVVVAGREPPHASWQLDLAWQQAMAVCHLGELTPDEARSLDHRPAARADRPGQQERHNGAQRRPDGRRRHPVRAAEHPAGHRRPSQAVR